MTSFRGNFSLVYIANIRLPTEQAHGYQVMKMCEAFARRGICVRLVIPDRKNAISDDPFAFYSIEPLFSIVRLSVIDFSYSFFRLFPPFSLFSHLLLSVSFLFRLIPFVRRHVVSDEVVYTRFFGAACLLPFRFHTGYEVHSIPRFARIFARLSKIPAVLFPTTRGMRGFFIRRGVPASRITVLPDGFDPRDFARLPSRDNARRLLALPFDRKIVCYVGRFTTFGNPKGVEDLVAAARFLGHRDALILLVGAMPHEMTRFPASPSVLIVPFMERSAALRYLVAADLLVMPFPSRPWHYRHAMSPLKMFEYMASGTPIVASDLPSIREVLSDRSAFLYQPDSLPDLARAIDAALTDSSGAASRARVARQDVEAYSWDARASAAIAALFPAS